MEQDTLDRQIIRETGMLEQGLARAIKQDARALSVGDQTRVERLTLPSLLPIVRAHLEEQLASYAPAPRKPEWVPILAGVDLDAAAAAALRGAFGIALKAVTLPKALKALSGQLETLYVHTLVATAASSKAEKARVASLVKGRTSQHARRAAIMKAGAAAITVHEAWTEAQQFPMGQPLLNAVLATGLFALEARPMKGKSQDAYCFVLSEDGILAAQEVEELGLLARPVLRPMLTRPRSWSSLTSGAYVSEEVSRTLGLVRTSERAHKRLLEGSVASGALSPMLQSVSAIQSVPLRISHPVLALRDWAWTVGLRIDGVLPLREAVPVPEVPEGLEGPARARLNTTRFQARRVNGGIVPNGVAFRSVTEEAQELAGEEEIFLPCTLDFRGRAYPAPFISHHGGDATKALFEFARGEPLGETGLGWLMIHTANSGDFGKVSKRSFQARVDWCDDNEAMIREVAADPQVNRQWTQADAPFSFYAACVDLVAAWDSPDPSLYVSHLPVALDGSNSGVQHYAACMRAPEGALVSITPAEAPADLYQAVADACLAFCRRADKLTQRRLEGKDPLVEMERLGRQIVAITAPAKAEELRLTAAQKEEVKALKGQRDFYAAVLWARVGVARSTVKRSVMTFGYSAVAFGFAQQIRDDFMSPLSLLVLQGDLPSHPFGEDEGWAASAVLGRLIYRTVVKVLPLVAAAMSWLQHAAQVLAEEQKGVLLVTPLGFPMLMKMTERTEKRVELLLLDRSVPVHAASTRDRVVGDSVLRRVQANVRVGGSKTVLTHKQRSGVAPNVIHTMDACHLHLTVLECRSRGLEDLILIHDSFASHAGKVTLLSSVLRETLLDLYSNFCPLQDVYDRAMATLSDAGKALLSPPPAKGSLDLEGVLGAEYAFS